MSEGTPRRTVAIHRRPIRLQAPQRREDALTASHIRAHGMRGFFRVCS